MTRRHVSVCGLSNTTCRHRKPIVTKAALRVAKNIRPAAAPAIKPRFRLARRQNWR
jgi:hypothetical protein